MIRKRRSGVASRGITSDAQSPTIVGIEAQEPLPGAIFAGPLNMRDMVRFQGAIGEDNPFRRDGDPTDQLLEGEDLFLVQCMRLRGEQGCEQKDQSSHGRSLGRCR